MKTSVLKPNPDSAAALCREAFEAMNEEEQSWLRWLAGEISERLVNPEDARDYLAKQKLDVDEQLAIWSLFNSKERSALKGKK